MFVDRGFPILKKPTFTLTYEATIQIKKAITGPTNFSVNINMIDHCKDYEYYIFGLNKDPDELTVDQLESLRNKSTQFVLHRESVPMKRVSNIDITFNNLDNSLIENGPIATSSYDLTNAYLNLMDEDGNKVNVDHGEYYIYIYLIHDSSHILTKKGYINNMYDTTAPIIHNFEVYDKTNSSITLNANIEESQTDILVYSCLFGDPLIDSNISVINFLKNNIEPIQFSNINIYNEFTIEHSTYYPNINSQISNISHCSKYVGVLYVEDEALNFDFSILLNVTTLAISPLIFRLDDGNVSFSSSHIAFTYDHFDYDWKIITLNSNILDEENIELSNVLVYIANDCVHDDFGNISTIQYEDNFIRL